MIQTLLLKRQSYISNRHLAARKQNNSNKVSNFQIIAIFVSKPVILTKNNNHIKLRPTRTSRAGIYETDLIFTHDSLPCRKSNGYRFYCRHRYNVKLRISIL